MKKSALILLLAMGYQSAVYCMDDTVAVPAEYGVVLPQENGATEEVRSVESEEELLEDVLDRDIPRSEGLPAVFNWYIYGVMLSAWAFLVYTGPV